MSPHGGNKEPCTHAETGRALGQLATELDELRKATAADLLVLRVTLKAAIPYCTDEARVAIHRALRALPDSGARDSLNVVCIRLQPVPLEVGALLPIHRPSWSGKPDPP